MAPRILSIVREFKAGLQRVYEERLRGVYLFGSFARGEEDEESDVDILVVLDDFESYPAELDRIAGLGSELSLKHGVSLSKVLVREEEWNTGVTPFLMNVREEAVAA